MWLWNSYNLTNCKIGVWSNQCNKLLQRILFAEVIHVMVTVIKVIIMNIDCCDILYRHFLTFSIRNLTNSYILRLGCEIFAKVIASNCCNVSCHGNCNQCNYNQYDRLLWYIVSSFSYLSFRYSFTRPPIVSRYYRNDHFCQSDCCQLQRCYTKWTTCTKMCMILLHVSTNC